MSFRLVAYVVLPVLLVASGWVLHDVWRSPDTAPAALAVAPVPAMRGGDILPSENSERLPPNHPPIGGATAALESMPSAGSEPPALAWKMPIGWQEAPSPNAMRLATYRAPDGVEVAISRAGGATEANIQRWVGQFDDVGREVHAERTVHGLHVVTVDISGTFVGGGMTPGATAESHPAWAMVGAVVESRSPSYFIKMTGPATAVRAARAAFDHLLDGITPL
ncbi:MAG TPA: hypothetical protein VIJ22_18515 [Polyangiaceae bacterium]